eukprot:TRINITY_DN14452_c0_g1_i1.p2 TRINITY_DN14452_c0_g1~~TRINITY_DN14452_c0_g1_i1.p2  ORF type:complete len:127 (-),score=29.79 TRINITY_DN14452_c0_g1_i1:40-420(-)
MGPDIKSPTLAGADSKRLRSGEMVGALEQGQVFEVSEVRQSQGQTYMKLADQDGWVFARGIAGKWEGQDIVQAVPESEAMEAKATMIAEKAKRALVQDQSDAIALYGLVPVGILVVLYQVYEYLNT